MQGFKSFAKRTEILFDPGINIIIGPNGSGKSNISDALCFVLGRLSIKSMRAAKSKNLLFMGSKYVKPAKEASVELVFTNKDNAFNTNTDEVYLKRIVRRNGQGIYKINNETKTRTEIIELLAHAGIDPYGFNIILQHQINSIVKMHPEERRKIIEEVAGISIYESRKEKSLHELEKTDSKLKEISTILRGRTSYLNKLEEERKQALHYKELQNTVQRIKATLLAKRKEEKEKELNSIIKAIEKDAEQKEHQKKKADSTQEKIEKLNEKISSINKHIQEATGLQQEQLRNEIANLRAGLEGQRVRKESYENRKEEIERRINEIEKSIPKIQEEIKELKEQSPSTTKKADELKQKKQELWLIEEERKKLLVLKAELKLQKEQAKDKQYQHAKVKAETDALIKQIEEQYATLTYPSIRECQTALKAIETQLEAKEEGQKHLQRDLLAHEKQLSVTEAEIARARKIKESIKQIDICPLCQTKITEEHLKHVLENSEDSISRENETKTQTESKISLLKDSLTKSSQEISMLKKRAMQAERELLQLKSLEEKQARIKTLVEEEKQLAQIVKELAQKQLLLENKTLDLSRTEERYASKLFEIEEISSRTEEDRDTVLLYTEQEAEKMENIVKHSKRDLSEIIEQITSLAETIETKEEELAKKEKQEEELNAKFKKLFADRDKLQAEIQENSINLSETQSRIRQIEEQINYLKIGKAKLEAEIEAVLLELGEFMGIEILQGSVPALQERLTKAQLTLQQIGSINMLALEVYDQVKKEYDAVYEKVKTLEYEKQEILKIIEEIDKKKKRTFMKTFKAMNHLFTQNFNRLSSKGIAYLELENKENIFEGGVTIVVKLAKGKYFDVTSLSGGEQTLVAIALLFAIQEYKPYHFYIFDEIDAALDKRNSERLTALLNQHIKDGQYIIVTHNDAVILNSNILYGVSMHEGVSKILSLKIEEQPASPAKA